MQVTQYLFQSPYQNQVQIGKPDPSSMEQSKESASKNPVDTLTNSSSEEKQQNMVYTNPNNLIDIYA